MKKPVSFCLPGAWVISVLFLFFFSITSMSAEKTAETVLEALSKRYQGTEAFSCNFQQSRQLEQLSGEILVKGSILFQKPHFLKLEMRGDENLDIISNAATVWIIDLDLDEVESFALQEARNSERRIRLLPLLVILDLESIAARFAVRLVPSQRFDQLELVPLAESGLPFESIQFAVDGFERIRWSEIVYPNGDRIHTNFENWDRLPRLSTHVFQYRQ